LQNSPTQQNRSFEPKTALGNSLYQVVALYEGTGTGYAVGCKVKETNPDNDIVKSF